MTNQTIIEPESFDVLVDDTTRVEPIIGLQVNPIDGESLVIPMTVELCATVARVLWAHVRVFDGPRATTPAKARLMAYPAKVAAK